MNQGLPPYLTRRRLAELLGIERATLSVWAKRHPDFPIAVSTGEGEAFVTAEILEWLGERPIPAKSLRSFEEAGWTYRTRLERILQQDRTDAGPVPPHPATAPDAEPWDLIDLMSGRFETSDLYLLVLFAIGESAARPDAWQRLLSDPHPDIRRIGWSLPEEVRSRLPIDAPDPEVFRLLFQAVDRVRKEIGPAAAFDGALARSASKAGRRGAGWVPTASTITELMARLVAPESATTIYDPACRAAELLVETARRSRLRDVSLHGNTRNPVSRALSEENAKVHGMTAIVDRTEYPWLSAIGYPSYSRVVCNPPFSLSLPDHAIPRPYALPPKRADFIWLLHAASSLDAEGHAAVLMPRGTLFRRGKERDIRENLVEGRVVEALVVLPPNLAADASISTVIWLLRPEGEARDDLLFVDASSLGTLTDRTTRILSEADLSSVVEVVETWRATGTVTDGGLAVAVSREAVRKADYLLEFSAYGWGETSSGDDGAPDVGIVLPRLQAAEREAERIDRDVADLLRRLRW